MSQPLKAIFEGNEYEFVGYLGNPKCAGEPVYYLAHDGTMRLSNVDSSSGTAHFRKLPKRHTFGGVVFEETGETRVPEIGEWCLGYNGTTAFFMYPGRGTTTSHTILVHVEVPDVSDD